jgi:hypothetical protein
MKNLLLSAFFVLAVSGTAFAQCQPGGNGNGWGNGNGNNGNGWGQGGNSAQAQPVVTISSWVALRVCQAAQPALYPYTGMTTFQLFSGYRAGTVSIEYLGRDPLNPSIGIYRTTAGGNTVISGIIDEL